jgi:hypothetical protein
MILRFWKWTCDSMNMIEYMVFWTAVMVIVIVLVLVLGGMI